MKKIFILATFLGASTIAYNQVIEQANSYITKNKDKNLSSNTGAVKAIGASLWNSDFSNPNDWTIGGNGSQGAWLIGLVADLPNALYYAPIQSTTVANGFAFFDGVQYVLSQTAAPQNAWIEMTNSINCSTHSIITLKFEQAYRAYNTDRTYVEISLDGGATWEQKIDINQSTNPNLSTTESIVYRNFNTNQSPTVKFRFRWENTSTSNYAGSGYAWQVDDVVISTLSDNDISIEKYTYGTTLAGTTLYYHQIPLAQAAPIESSANLKNLGSQDQSAVVFTASETVNGIYSGSSTPVGILSGGEDSVVVTTNFTPSAIGDYELDFSTSFGGIDDNPLNNTVNSYKFSVGENIFARDSSTLAASAVVYDEESGAYRSPPTSMRLGNLFIPNQDAILTAIDFQFGNLIPIGSEVYGEVYDENLNIIPGSLTEPYITQIADEGEYKTLILNNPIDLIAGEKYTIVVSSVNPNLSIALAGKSEPSTSFIYYSIDGIWYYTSRTPVIRMNFLPAASISRTTISGFSQLVGSPSAADSFNVEGFNLTGDITVTAPPYFEISNTLAGPYSSSLTLTNLSGSLALTKVYIRLNGPVINYSQSGDIIVSSSGAVDRLIALHGETYDYINLPNGTATNIDTNGEGTLVGSHASLTGILHCDNFSNTGYDLTLIDNNGDGINIFLLNDLNGYVPTEGDQLMVEGQIEQYNGLIRIKPATITVLSQGENLDPATLVTELNESTENKFIELVGLNLVNGETIWPINSEVEVTNGITTFQVKISDASFLAGTPTPSGPFYLTGIGRQDDTSLPYNSNYQIFPCGVGPSCATIMSVTNNGGVLKADVSGLNYQWIDCADSSLFIGEINQTFTAPEGDGLYAVIISDGACVDTSNCILVQGVGTESNDFKGVSVYPNPMNDVLKIINDNGLLESVELSTAAGRIVYSSKINSGEHEINVSRISSGIYFVKVKSANKMKIFKVIK